MRLFFPVFNKKKKNQLAGVESMIFGWGVWFDKYRNDPKFSDRQVCANSADPDQTAQSDQSTLFAIPSASFGLITLW